MPSHPSAFCAFRFVICLSITMAAFQYNAFLAFPPIKRGKLKKQRTVFLMCTVKVTPYHGILDPPQVLPCHCGLFLSCRLATPPCTRVLFVFLCASAETSQFAPRIAAASCCSGCCTWANRPPSQSAGLQGSHYYSVRRCIPDGAYYTNDYTNNATHNARSPSLFPQAM